ncbi:dienelactone hydrolase endo-1-3,1,4-beta-D-glucanase [Thelephora terrestris]|uniref:Dienelactone hydrolase endo-1-3,1,4-beta-D-glucanase n=1 Tax=Thelephora terrestris TaxID=56493 RepID=A0A9P6L7V2_9AGAM|nr:dienelactone hydrolase endo-1-3,1,4-beta-D-glucanase [Thelephora terrestris]
MSCPDCTSGNSLPGSPKGTEENGVYFAKGSSQPDTKDKAVIVFTDIFGLSISNPKVIADTIAERTGFDVWVPDLFDGRIPVKPEVLDFFLPRHPGEKMGLWRKVRFYWTLLTHIPGMIGCRPAVVDPRAKEFLTKIKAEHGYKSIGVVGYCFGGAISIRLAPLDAVTSVVIAHPAPSTLDAIKAINVPVSWACAEEDDAFPKELRLQAEAHFKSRTPELQYEFVDYPGTVHGFAARPAREQPLSVEGHEKALEQTIKWFQSTL